MCIHHWTVHAKVEFQKFPPNVRSGGSILQLLILNWEMNLKNFHQMSGPRGVNSTTFDPKPRNERFTLIYFIGSPVILSALQPFKICIFDRKNSKLTFSNGPQLMGKRFMTKLHASLDSTCKSRIWKISTRCQIRGSIAQSFILNWEMNLKNFHLMSGPRGVHSTSFDP